MDALPCWRTWSPCLATAAFGYSAFFSQENTEVPADAGRVCQNQDNNAFDKLDCMADSDCVDHPFSKMAESGHWRIETDPHQLSCRKDQCIRSVTSPFHHVLEDMGPYCHASKCSSCKDHLCDQGDVDFDGRGALTTFFTKYPRTYCPFWLLPERLDGGSGR